MRMIPMFLHTHLIALILLSVSTVTIAITPAPPAIPSPMPVPILPPPMPMPSPVPLPMKMPEPELLISPQQFHKAKTTTLKRELLNSVTQTDARVADSIVIAELAEIKAQGEHYYSQAKTYETAVLALRIAVLVCSVLAAVVLALSSADWSRRAALVMSIGAATVPAADQIFQVSEMHRVSWRTAVEVSRLFGSCKANWTFDDSSRPPKELKSVASALVSQCREKLAGLVDAEMATSLKPLQLSTKIETK